MVETDKNLSKLASLINAPMTIVRSDFPNYPKVDALNDWAWVWEAMSVTFLHARQHECLPHWRIEPRRLPNSILFFVHEGKARWWIGDFMVVAEAKDLLIVPEGISHFAEHAPERKFCVSAVHFTVRIFDALDVLSLLGFPVHIPKMPQVEESINELLRISACQPIGWRKRGEALVIELILRIVQERPNLLRPMRAPIAVKNYKVLQPVLQLVEERLADKLSVKEMAKAANCSERHLRRIFKETLGMSPKKWLLQRRLQRAALLLTQTDLTVKIVANKCGFEDLSLFNRQFRQRFGQPPTHYRRTALKAF
ncbi:helix-turn-helix domain-containing protein [Fervidibacter sacchari]|jgi:Transcriptional regulator containing an amidase domain and an AraC-type DNA-binding HTH domain|uniref:AraC-like DNA-binding protein n=1 Tax=Candidatus Fervidibacter sacchari TaxID=1448929 RepID=A0ABT2ELV5_9BACT|nr:helix-turn-helix domain-containing protein [Candidatus Fervidibacter sacchari]MCS3917920.1 AraC-like DNA-binding protein [Candidatus Fervidibacter sacchari]WKU15736.1 helix-turn-helix domain-containing protein [Candidatus Fervidibacter sacchari]